MDEIILADDTDLKPKQLQALALWIKDPNYAEVGRVMGFSRVYARRLVLEAVAVRVAEILPAADEYLILQLEVIQKRLAQLDHIITRNEVVDDDNIILLDDVLKAMMVERGYLSDLTKLLGLAAPDKLVVAVVPARPLTDTERAERMAKWVTHVPLLEDIDDGATDRHDPTGASNGRPVGSAPRE